MLQLDPPRSISRLQAVIGAILVGGFIVLAAVIIAVMPGAGAATSSPRLSVSPSSQRVSAGETLAIDVRVSNSLTTTVERAIIRLSYDRQQLVPINSHFSRNSDWVMNLTDSEVKIELRDIGAGKSRTGTIYFTVQPVQPGNTIVTPEASLSWRAGSRSGRSSDTGPDVLIFAPQAQEVAAAAYVSPGSGPIGGKFMATGNGLIAGERVSAWLNTPAGVRSLNDADLLANGQGNVSYSIDSSNLAPGGYGLVFYGHESTRTLVAPFAIGENVPPPPPVAPPAAPPPPPPPAAGGSASVAPPTGMVGGSYLATGNGFIAGERISAWLNTPSGVRSIDDSKLTANGQGVTTLLFNSGDMAPGNYKIVLYGQESARIVAAPFTISVSAPAPVAPAPPSQAPGITISPGTATTGTLFYVNAVGFEGNEAVSAWLNMPGETVQAIDVEIKANGQGSIVFAFNSTGLRAGNYGLVVYGRDSKRTLVVPFMIGR